MHFTRPIRERRRRPVALTGNDVAVMHWMIQ
jgi:hypothetical protein